MKRESGIDSCAGCGKVASVMIPQKQMTEEDIKLRYITPAITAKWDIELITMETPITDGKINLRGNFVFRDKPKKADKVGVFRG